MNLGFNTKNSHVLHIWESLSSLLFAKLTTGHNYWHDVFRQHASCTSSACIALGSDIQLFNVCLISCDA